MADIKCKNYNACRKSCLACDILTNKQCDIEIDLDTPKKFVVVQRRDCNTSWNECPTCGNSIGYHPDIKDFRCKRCNQRISWE